MLAETVRGGGAAAGAAHAPPVRRLLFVVNDADFFVSHRLPLAVAARDAGWEVHVATAPSPSLTRLRERGLHPHAVPLRRSAMGPVGELAAVRSLVRLYRAVRPDVVHHVTVKPVLYGSVAARLAGVPAVVNAVSGLGYLFLARGPAAAARRAAVVAAYRVAFGHRNMRAIFQNDEDAETFRRLRIARPSDVVMIRGSGVDLARYAATPEPDGAPLVVLAARLLRDKGVEEFVAAAAALRASGSAARFALVGDTDPGNPTAVARAALEAWQRDGVIEWWGRRDDIPAVFAEAAIVCLPSYREGMPKVLLEAAACARPVVTTDVPGCRDAVVRDATGLLVPPRDPDALGRALATLLADPGRRRRMGAAARAHAEAHFDVRAVAARTVALYDEVARR